MIETNDKIMCNNIKPLDGNDVAPPLTQDAEYSVIEIYTCQCGKEHLNVGLPLEVNWVRCYNCEEELPDGTHWCHPSRFIKIG